MMHSSDISGPLINPRHVALWTWVDPLSFRENFRYDFDLHLFDAVQTESQAQVVINEKILKEGTTYNDYYGFGTSRDEATREAQGYLQDFDGAAVSVLVTTKVSINAVFHDPNKEPFYNGAVRCFTVPGTWYAADKSPLRSTLTFVSWDTGAPGKDAAALNAYLASVRSQDAAGALRKGALR